MTARWILLVLAGLAASCLETPYSLAEPSETEALTATLASQASYMETLQVCQRLAEIGDESSVPALAALLTDEQLSHPARIALEAIPSEAAGDALRGALPQLEGDARIGVIQSLGVRRDAESTELLQQLLQDPDPATASAAATALGKIATTKAADALSENLASAPTPVRKNIANALLHVAEVHTGAREAAQAIALYDQAATADLPQHIRLAAARALILHGSNTAERLRELIRGDKSGFAMALEVARSMPSGEVASVVTSELPDSPPERQALLLALLGDAGDKAALPAVVKAAQSEKQNVRVAALGALGSLGDASTLPLLLDAATEDNQEVAQAANESLTWLGDAQVDAELARRLSESGEGLGLAKRQLLIELAGRRRIKQAIPALLEAAEAPHPSIRLAAIRSLGQTLPAERLEPLTARLLAPQTPAELTAVQSALRTACIRTADREAAASQLVNCLPQASSEVKEYLIDLLGDVGGSVALEAVGEAALQPELQDTATRVLGEWMTPDAASALLAVVRQSPEQRFRIRALRGCLRIVRQFDVPNERRVAMCARALELAERNEERVLALESLTRVPTTDALELAKTQLSVEGLTDAAADAAITIGEQIAASAPEAVSDAMAAVIKATENPDILARARRLAAQVAPQ